MTCGADCCCLNEPFECIAADPAYAHLRAWCAATGDDPESRARRDHVRNLSRRRATAPSPPSLLKKATNFAGAMIEHTLAGSPSAGPSEAARRLDICRACPNLAGNSCRLCGCNMPIKVTWAGQHCPIGQW